MSTATAPRASSPSEQISKSGVRTVLVIDDTAVGLKSAEMVLQRSGFNTLIAEGGEQHAAKAGRQTREPLLSVFGI